MNPMMNMMQGIMGGGMPGMGGGGPMQMIMQMMQGGGNPQQMIQKMVEQNPQMKQAMPLVQGKNPQQLQQTFMNLCKERGIDPGQFAQQMGMTLPK